LPAHRTRLALPGCPILSPPGAGCLAPQGGARLNRVVNGVFVAVVAFFGVLAVASLAGFRPTAGAASGAASVADLHVAWTRDGDALAVTVVLRAPGHEARATAVDYEVAVNGRTYASDRVAVEARALPGRDADVAFEADLGDDFASRWWPSHLEGGERSTLVVRGVLHATDRGAERELAFEWTSPWKGGPTDLLSSLADCPAPESPVCLDASLGRVDDDRLGLWLQVRNQADEDLWAAGGDVTLSLDGRDVATGHLEPADLPARRTTRLETLLVADADAIDAWWPGHAARCESSLAAVTVELRLEDAYGFEVGTARWSTPPATFTTAFACGGAA
jgi:LEA14-like dessication related protein